MSNLLDDYIFSPSLRYEAHRLIYTPANDSPIELTGFLGASVLAALLVDTPEGDARGLAVDSEEQREQFFLRYEREVRRDDWGYLDAEVGQLHDSYVQLALSETELYTICPNVRLLSLAIQLMETYMQRLVKGKYREHIWECCPWEAPFAQWLWDAAHVETHRQRLLHMNWSDMALVCGLADAPEEEAAPTLPFEGEKAMDIMVRYLQWLNDEYVAIKQEQPGAKITNSNRRHLVQQETDWAFIEPDIEALEPDFQKDWKQWMNKWNEFLSKRILIHPEIRFWENDVPEEVQEHLLYHLRLQESHTAHFRDLTTAVYAMRQLGYIRRKLSDTAIRQWLSEHLSIDYTLKNNASQFQRAMKEHGRYTPEVQDAVRYLHSMGYYRFQCTLSPSRV